MRRTIVLLTALLATVALAFSPAQAAAGCEAITTGHPITHGNCRYTATGPGTFQVATLSGFRIMASPDGGTTWATLARGGGTIRMGTIETKAGDLVDVAITPALFAGAVRYQDGYIKAGDA